MASWLELLLNTLNWSKNLFICACKLYWKPLMILLIMSWLYVTLGGVVVSKYTPLPPMTTYQNILLTLYGLLKGFCILWMSVATFLYRHRKEYYIKLKDDE